MKYHALFVIFEKAEKFEIIYCRLLQIIGGALWVKILPTGKFCMLFVIC